MLQKQRISDESLPSGLHEATSTGRRRSSTNIDFYCADAKNNNEWMGCCRCQLSSVAIYQTIGHIIATSCNGYKRMNEECVICCNKVKLR